jgi:hypothetical protein
VFVEKLVILGNIPVVKIGNPEIEKNIKKERKIKNCEIKTVLTRSYNILHGTVDAKNPEWLHQQVKKKQKTKVGNKFTLHFSALGLRQ